MADPHYQDARVAVYAGDCLDVLRHLDDASVDAVVTDPPYGLEFMGKEWDKFRVDDPGSKRHRGERAGSHGELISQDTEMDAHPARKRLRCRIRRRQATFDQPLHRMWQARPVPQRPRLRPACPMGKGQPRPLRGATDHARIR